MDAKEIRVNRLRGWLTENKGSLQKSVEILYDHEYGYQLKASPGFTKSKPVVHVPRALTLSISNLSSSQSKWPREFLDLYKNEPYVVTRFLLVDEYLHQEASWWWPYISTLPQPHESQPFNTTLWFNDEDLVWLEGTSLHLATKQRLNHWRQEFEIGLTYLSALDRVAEFSWTIYKWAATVLSSRCFPNKPPSNSQKIIQYGSDREMTPHEGGNDADPAFPVLVPVLDLANHNPRAVVEWIINDSGYTLLAQSETDTQLYNNYGAKGNEELLLGYGFIIENNPADSVGLICPIPESLQKKYAKEVLQANGCLPLSISPGQLGLGGDTTPTEFKSSLDVFHLRKDHPVPQTLLDTIKLSVANERDLKTWYLGKQSISRRLSTQAIGQLILALITRNVTLHGSIAISDTKPSNIRQEMAQKYVHSQARILDHHIGILQHGIEIEDNLWTIQDVLQSSPEILKSAMSGLSRTVCGTRKYHKLIEQDRSDAFMVIFICLLWLVCKSSQADSESHFTVSDENEKTIASKLQNWYRFIQATYCHPSSDDDFSCKSLNCRCINSTRQQPWTLPLDDEDTGMKAFSIIQRAYLLQDIHPVFQDSEIWTKEFIQWGLGIWTSEAVLLPVSASCGPKLDHDGFGIYDFTLQKGLYLDSRSD